MPSVLHWHLCVGLLRDLGLDRWVLDAPSSQRPHHSKPPTLFAVKTALVSISPSLDCVRPSLVHGLPTESWLLAVPSSSQDNARLWPLSLARAGLPTPWLSVPPLHTSTGSPHPQLLSKEGLGDSPTHTDGPLWTHLNSPCPWVERDQDGTLKDLIIH